MYFRVFIIASMAFLTSCVQLSGRYLKGSDYEKALVLYEHGELLEARKKAEDVRSTDANYKAAVKLASDITAVLHQASRRHMELGEDFERAGVYRRALDEYSIAVKYNRSNLLAANKLVALQDALKHGKKPDDSPSAQLAKARKKVKAADEELSAASSAHYIRGRAYFESRAYNKAIEEFKAALKINPDYLDARDMIDRSVKERDKAIDTHLKNGIGYFHAEEMDLAIKEWNRVLALDPDNKKAADYKYRAEVIMDSLKKIRERKTSTVRPL